MLTIDLGRLYRDRSLRVDARLPPDDPLFAESELTFARPLGVDAEASVAGSGEVVVRCSLDGALSQECRRCLAPVESEIDREITLVYAPTDELDEPDPEVRALDEAAEELDIGSAIREELILDLDRYVTCDPECLGLCPICGIDKNEESCDCTLEEPDPRWDALRALNTD